jgi:integrase/recombinase XerD
MFLGTIRNSFKLELDACNEEELLGALNRMHDAYKPGYYFQLVVIVKSILRFLRRHDLNDRIAYPKKPDRATQIRDKLLSRDEVELLISRARNLQERLMIEILSETGCRVGELVHLKIKSVQFDEYGAILTLSGKTGTRRRRIYGAVDDLRHQVNNHPLRDNPEAPLLLTSVGTPLKENTAWHEIRELGLKALRKPVNPHQFRHTRATEDSRYFTDRELMMLNGWTSPDTVTVYTHLSMRDVEDKDLVLHGLKSKEEMLRPIKGAQLCLKCGGQNAPVAIYCADCGEVLGNGSLDKLLSDNQLLKSFVNHPAFQEALRKTLAVSQRS